MAPSTDVKGKTEQRVTAVVSLLRRSVEPLSYEDLRIRTGTPYDALLYMLSVLVEVGLVTKSELAEGPGRPRSMFLWFGDILED